MLGSVLMFCNRKRRLVLLVWASGLVAIGCTSVTELLNPQFLGTVGSSNVASLPGEAPAVLVTVQNQTSKNVEVTISYRSEKDTVQTYTAAVAAGESTAQALICPILEITLGDVTDLTRSGAIVRLGNGTADDPFVSVEAFGVLMKSGVNYNCGDALTFAVIPSSATTSGYQTIVYIRRAEQ
jgi:hypothetical protein